VKTAPENVATQIPPVGNLKQRAIELSNEIKNMPLAGRMPATRNEAEYWVHIRSTMFRLQFLQRVRDLRDEFSQLHLRDKRVDDLLRYEDMYEETRKQLSLVKYPYRPPDLWPQHIEDVVDALKQLASQLPN
jgi:hypothetical protein